MFGVQELAVPVIVALLEERPAKTLDDAAADLLVDELRVDHPAAILHAPVLQELDETGLGIDLQVARLYPVGEGERIVRGDEVARLHQLARQVLRQCVAAEIDDPAKLLERHARLAAGLVADLAIDDVEFIRRALQHRGGDRQDALLQRKARLKRGLAADARPARGPGSPAIGGRLGVARHHLHPRDRHADGLGDDLRQHRLGPLPLLGDARHGNDAAVGIHAHGAAVLRRDARTADAVHERARIGQLDEAGDADAAMDALLSQRCLLGPQAVIVHQFQKLGE